MNRNRLYKKGEPFRDARLFVIACEGAKREKIYFEKLGHGSRRLKVKILSPEVFENGEQTAEESGSAPKWLINRLVEYLEKEGVNEDSGDKIWIVMDVDRWKTDQLYEIFYLCQDHRWTIALSNPCFEVWLFTHIKSIKEATSKTSKQFKFELNTLVKGGYRVEDFISLIPEALKRVSDVEDDFQSPIPAFGISRVHLLVREIKEMF